MVRSSIIIVPFFVVAALWSSAAILLFGLEPTTSSELPGNSAERTDSPFKLVTTSGSLVRPPVPLTDAVRILIEQDGTKDPQLIVTNTNPWSEQIDIVWEAEAPRNAVSKTSDTVTRFEDVTFDDTSIRPTKNRTRWRFEIAAKSTANWQWKYRASNIYRWESRITPGTLTKLETQLNQLSQSMSQLSTFQPFENTPIHGNFETIEAGRLVPIEWSSSLTPSAEWSVNQDLFRSGKQSLQFKNQRAGTKGWLQSPSMAMPSDGRIAGAAWISIDQGTMPPNVAATTAILNREGDRSEWQHVYPSAELARNGDAWQRIDFPILTRQSLGNAEFADLRVRFTLDIEGISKVSIDDFFAGRVFLDEIERRELRSALYVARRELSQSLPQAAWDLTQSELFRYVTENAPKTLPSGSESKMPHESVFSTPRVEPRKAFFDNARRRNR
jgi:hypothetical protein